MSTSGLKDFKEYLNRYCKNYGITEEEALTHKVVHLVASFYGLTIAEYLSLGEDSSVKE